MEEGDPVGIGEQPASSIFQEIKDIELDGIMGNEQVIIEESTNPEGNSYVSFAIQRFDTGLGDWSTEYVWTMDNPFSADVENGYWNVTGAPAVLLKVLQRDSGGLSYRIVGYSRGSLNELVARDNIAQGNAFFYGGSIIEQVGTEYSIWVVMDGELTLVPY
jgi:hypothetical protein